MKGQSAYIPPPVPRTITLLMFCKNFTLALLECLLSAFPSEASQMKEKSEEVNRLHFSTEKTKCQTCDI